ncbi:MAG: MBL fold metallo-hydrolase [Betaproteobacteria bacterium]|nr:MBL fold metallo-hydrolase [Betaproteobacteria bacterium]
MAFFCKFAAAQPNFDAVTIKTHKVSEGIYALEGEGGNIGVSVGDDGVIIIDDQFAPLTPKITAAIRALSDKPLRFVLNTHWHFDHTGGNENLGNAGAVIVAHDNVYKRMSTEQFIEFFKMKLPPSPKAALPVITFTDSVTFRLNGDELNGYHVKHAHTDGDMIVRFRKANAVHMGDIYFSFMYPFIDLGSGGSVRGVLAAVDGVLGTIDDNTRIIPGHGPISSKKDLRAYRDMLARVSANISRLIKAKKTLAQVVAAQPTREFDAVWGNGFLKPDQFVEIVYKSMNPEKAAAKAR